MHINPVSKKKIHIFLDDLPNRIDVKYKSVAIDTEAMGLNLNRDRLCLIQLTFDSNECYLVKISENSHVRAKNLIQMLESDILMIFHYARFDVSMIFKTFGIMPKNIYCTKIASKIARTYTDRHGLKTLCNELLGIDISKKQQSSDWGQDVLSHEQKEYAATDVMYLHTIMQKLNTMLVRESREHLAQEAFGVLGSMVKFDLAGWNAETLFTHL